MTIGIIGYGVVGQAIAYGFRKLGHKIYIYDSDKGYKDLVPLLVCEVIYLCLPTKMNKDGSCDVSIIKETIDKLSSSYNGVIAIKSTVEPGTTDKLIEKYPHKKIAMVPEFLRQEHAISDFIENHWLCAIGTYNRESYETIKESHGNLPKKVIKLKPIQSELLKYFVNSFNATRITFSNSFAEICKKYDTNYTEIKNAAVNIEHIVDKYLDSNENFKAFGLACLPKDTAALSYISKDTKTRFFDYLLSENEKYK